MVGLRVEPLAGQEQVRSADRSYSASSSPSGSSFLIARNAVGAVNIALTPCSATTRQNAPASGRADRLALVEHGGRADQQRRVDDVGVADDPADVGGGAHDVARADVVDVRASTRPARPRGRRCRAPRPSASRWCPRCRGCRAGRWPGTGTGRGRRRPRPSTAAQSTSRRRPPRSPRPAGAAGRRSASGWCAASPSASSSSGLYSIDPGRPRCRRRRDDHLRARRRRSARRAPWARSRRTPPSARRRSGRRRASRPPPRGPSACR